MKLATTDDRNREEHPCSSQSTGGAARETEGGQYEGRYGNQGEGECHSADGSRFTVGLGSKRRRAIPQERTPRPRRGPTGATRGKSP